MLAAIHWHLRKTSATQGCDLAHSDLLLASLTLKCCGYSQSPISKKAKYCSKSLWEKQIIYMKKIFRICIFTDIVGARRVPTQNWIHWYPEALLLPGGTQAPIETRELMHGSWSPFRMTKNLPAHERAQMLPWKQKGTCRILNFPSLHQLAEFTGHESVCMSLLGVWGCVRYIIDFNQQNSWLYLKESLLLPTPLFQHHLLHITQRLFKELSHKKKLSF